MRILWILIKKEWLEALRNKKLLSLAVLFVFFALLSPLSARFMNEILKAVVTDPALGDLSKLIPEPTYLDSYRQFYKNFSQMGILIILLVFMGLVSSEKSKGTAVLVLTKGVPRASFILAKFISAFMVFLASYFVATAIFLYYTRLLFGTVFDASTIPTLLFFGVFVIFIIALSLFCSTFSKSTGQSAIMVITTYFLLSLLGSFPPLREYLPVTLIGFSYPLSDAANAFLSYRGPMISSLVLTAILLALSVASFKNQEI